MHIEACLPSLDHASETFREEDMIVIAMINAVVLVMFLRIIDREAKGNFDI